MQYRKKYSKKKSYWIFGYICLYLHPQNLTGGEITACRQTGLSWSRSAKAEPGSSKILTAFRGKIFGIRAHD